MDLLQWMLLLTLGTSILYLSGLHLQIALMMVGSGVASWAMTKGVLPRLKILMLSKNIFGMDINKKGTQAGQKKIPESMGFAAAVTFCLVGFAMVPIIGKFSNSQSLLRHLAVLLTVLGTILLGFADDTLQLKWRYKLLFPFFIIIPLVSIYAGPTHFEVIYPFSLIFGRTFEWGPLYLFYITCLGIYKTNAINIYAGINGLQVGQSIVAATSMLLYFFVRSRYENVGDRFEYSSFLLVVLIGGSLALLKLNQFPSQIFIGDTFCYYSGIVLAIAAIYAEIPVVCHWFFIPQLINFLYSLPQLTGYVQCPRHRLAKYHLQTDTLHAIETNMNMLNLWLRVKGPTHESTLCKQLIFFQWTFSMVPIFHLILFWSQP